MFQHNSFPPPPPLPPDPSVNVTFFIIKRLEENGTWGFLCPFSQPRLSCYSSEYFGPQRNTFKSKLKASGRKRKKHKNLRGTNNVQSAKIFSVFSRLGSSHLMRLTPSGDWASTAFWLRNSPLALARQSPRPSWAGRDETLRE